MNCINLFINIAFSFKVSRVLPDWLANPSIIHNDLNKAKVELENITCLDEDLMEKLRKNEIQYLFPGKTLITTLCSII